MVVLSFREGLVLCLRCEVKMESSRLDLDGDGATGIISFNVGALFVVEAYMTRVILARPAP